MKKLKKEQLKDYLYKDNTYIFGSAYGNDYFGEENANFLADLIREVEIKLGKPIKSINFDDKKDLINIILELNKNEQLYMVEYLLELFSFDVDNVYNEILKNSNFNFAREIILSIVDEEENSDKIIEKLEKKYNLEFYEVEY